MIFTIFNWYTYYIYTYFNFFIIDLISYTFLLEIDFISIFFIEKFSRTFLSRNTGIQDKKLRPFLFRNNLTRTGECVRISNASIYWRDIDQSLQCGRTSFRFILSKLFSVNECTYPCDVRFFAFPPSGARVQKKKREMEDDRTGQLFPQPEMSTN